MQHRVHMPRDMDVVGDVGPDEPEATVFEKVFHIDRVTGAEVVEADDLVPVLQESVAQVRSEEARTSCDNCTSNPHDLSPSACEVLRGAGTRSSQISRQYG